MELLGLLGLLGLSGLKDRNRRYIGGYAKDEGACFVKGGQGRRRLGQVTTASEGVGSCEWRRLIKLNEVQVKQISENPEKGRIIVGMLLASR